MNGYVTVHVVVSEPDTEVRGECPDCGFDSVLTFPLKVISPYGVTSLPPRLVCTRCWEAEQ